MVKHSEASKRIGSNLKKIRLHKRMMQIDVAVATELNRTYISRIETGKARVTFALLRKLVIGLEITSTELIEDNVLAFVQQIVYGDSNVRR